jgi:glycosyltransferase involved in cell wall biosynthesis
MTGQQQRLALVIQRYGLEVNGGAELHCRWIAESLKDDYHVEVLTTRALDYLTWKNSYPSRDSDINGVRVRRFGVRRTRNTKRFGRIQHFIFNHRHTDREEHRWLKEEGPYAPSLVKYIRRHADRYDCFIFFSYRYYTTFHGLLQVPEKSLLVPTAEEDPVIKLMIFKEFFNKPRGIIYNSPEEKEMIQFHTENHRVPGEITGVGIHVTENRNSRRFREKYGIDGPYLIYLGRIDENKGCEALFDHFVRYYTEVKDPPVLVLIGRAVMDIPGHRGIRHLGFVSDQDKYDALEGAELLVMPSLFESLSMVLLEAWALSKPVLVNGDCPVLRGQVLRSNGGLYFRNYPEFRESLSLLLSDTALKCAMGESGRHYFSKNYSWPIIREKYSRMIGWVLET